MSKLDSFDKSKKKCQYCGKYFDKKELKRSAFHQTSLCPSCWKRENDMLDNIVGNDDDFFNEYEYE
jgi:hypothetical protein